MSIGFIGLGAMGKPMAKRLLSMGPKLCVYDVLKEAREELASLGADLAGSPGEVALNSEIICFSLPNSAVLKNVLTAEDGVFKSLKPKTLLIDFSSVDPDVSKEMAALAINCGGYMIDAPVSGGVTGAEKGQLTAMIGGSPEDYLKALPVLKGLTKETRHIGPSGAGQAMKLVNNLLLGINMVATSEALVLGTKLGLKPQTMLEVISQSSGHSYALSAKAENFIFKGDFQKGFAIDLQYKDLEMATSAAKKKVVPLFLGNLSQQLFEMARAKGLGREDISSVIKIFEELSQTEVRTKS